MGDVFTPMNETRTKRLEFKRSDVKVLGGNLNVRGLGYHATIEINGKVYKVIGIACSLPHCQCDVFIKEVTKAA